MASILQSPGLALYAVPALWALSIAPHFLAAGLSKSSKDVPDFTNTSCVAALQIIDTALRSVQASRVDHQSRLAREADAHAAAHPARRGRVAERL